MAEDDTSGAPAAAEPKATGYSWYVLSVLVVVYILNFIDRQIISILAVDIKADLGLSDGDMGFLGRSEEHTSELQSLMRISYAAFCLTKKQNKYIDNKLT